MKVSSHSFARLLKHPMKPMSALPHMPDLSQTEGSFSFKDAYLPLPNLVELQGDMLS